MRRENSIKGDSSSVREQLEKHYWIEQDTLYYETFSKLTRVVYHAKIRKDGSLSIAWSVDEAILILCVIVLTMLSAIFRQSLILVPAVFALIAAVFMLAVNNRDMRNTYANA